MRVMTTILSKFTRRTGWSEGHIFSITPEQIGIVEGLRASLAIAVMLAADLQLHIPGLAYGAVAAFWTCLCDPAGSDRTRLKALLTFALGATLAISLAAYCAHWGKVAGGAALFVLVLICGLTRSYRPTFGPMPAPAGLIIAIAVVVGVTSPRSAAGALELAACFLAGAVWALVLCIYIWRTHPRAPARRALVAIFARLEQMAASLQQLDLTDPDVGDQWSDFNVDQRRAVRFSIERGRETVARLPVGRRHFTQGIDTAGRVFAALMALGQHRMESARPFDATVARPLLDGLRQLLQQAMLQSGHESPAPERLLSQGDLLFSQATACQSVVGHAVAVAAGAMVELGRHWQAPEREDPVGDEATVPAKFNILAPVWRQALRTAVAVAICYSFGAYYDVSFSYWGTIAALVLMQPLGANTWLRVVERASGSVVGGVITAVLIARLSGPWEMLLFITPLAAAVIALRLVNYGLFIVFVTPMFVLVSDFIHPASNLVATRAINETIGACIGLAGSLLLWPEKEEGALSDAILGALSANMAFASGVLRAPLDGWANIDQLRRDAGIASSRAEVARQRMLLEGRAHAMHLDSVRDILVSLRAICGAANIVAIIRQLEPGDGDAARAEHYEALAKMLRMQITGSDERTVSAALEMDGADDLDHAVHALALAIHDYASIAHAAGG